MPRNQKYPKHTLVKGEVLHSKNIPVGTVVELIADIEKTKWNPSALKGTQGTVIKDGCIEVNRYGRVHWYHAIEYKIV